MCGLAGAFSLKGVTANDLDRVSKMNLIQRHRGPDDEGIFNDCHCVIGHRRLAIIDLSRNGHQPFASDDGRFELVFNGEIYNYIELREELSHKGRQFRTQTDTEVLLKSYQEYGSACLSRFNGMFALAIYDTHEQSLFLARDRMGVKPLYYTINDDKLYFASEIKALVGCDAVRPTLNFQALFDYLVFNRTDIFDETFIREIRRLPKGCYAHFGSEGMAIRQWWNPEDYLDQLADIDLRTAMDAVEETLVSAVSLRMRSDVPVGSCLSGGLDSSILLGILFEHCGAPEPYPTFTAAFPGHPIDETRYIDALKARYAFCNHRTFPDGSTALKRAREFVFTNDEPTTSYSFYSQFEVMALAKSKGVTVLLDGQGGDEDFAGYQYFHGFHLYGLLRRYNLAAFSNELVRSIWRKQHSSAYETLLFQVAPRGLKKKLLKMKAPHVDRDFFEAYVNSSRIFNEFFAAESLNQSIVKHFQYKLEHLLRMEDRNSMAFSLEARVPYLDYRLVELTLGIPESFKISRGETKWIQKAALGRYTVPEILKRTDKIGFGTPGEEWMMSKPWKKLTFEHYETLLRSLPQVFTRGCPLPNNGFDRWKINQLALWKDLFID